jgi:KipI family sensor histidine kinase inhibitor
MPAEIVALGDSALVIRVGDSSGEILRTARKLAAAKIGGVQEIVPAFASVGIFFHSTLDLDAAAQQVRAALKGRSRSGSRPAKSRLIEVPVCYAPEFAPDLEAVAKHCRLSPEDVCKRHAAARYQVRCVGFTPGFPYLSGLPRQLAMPRRATPRASVPAGSVAIGGAQTGIYPLASPGGWNIIGRTPLRLFDPGRDPAAVLRPGDQVRFRAISAEEFEQWAA